MFLRIKDDSFLAKGVFFTWVFFFSRFVNASHDFLWFFFFFCLVFVFRLVPFMRIHKECQTESPSLLTPCIEFESGTKNVKKKWTRLVFVKCVCVWERDLQRLKHVSRVKSLEEVDPAKIIRTRARKGTRDRCAPPSPRASANSHLKVFIYLSIEWAKSRCYY